MTQMLRNDSPAALEERERPLLLIVEDDPHDRQIYGTMLCYNGYDVVFAGSVQEGLEAAAKHAPDLVVLDLGLPDGSGLDICTALRDQRPEQALPIIVLSGFTQNELGSRAAEAGCSLYIEKPASPIDVLHHIEDLIGRAPLSGEGRPPRLIE